MSESRFNIKLNHSRQLLITFTDSQSIQKGKLYRRHKDQILKKLKNHRNIICLLRHACNFINFYIISEHKHHQITSNFSKSVSKEYRIIINKKDSLIHNTLRNLIILVQWAIIQLTLWIFINSKNQASNK